MGQSYKHSTIVINVSRIVNQFTNKYDSSVVIYKIGHRLIITSKLLLKNKIQYMLCSYWMG